MIVFMTYLLYKMKILKNFNELLEAEQNVDKYLNSLIKKAVSNKAIYKEHNEIKRNFICLLNKTLNDYLYDQNYNYF